MTSTRYYVKRVNHFQRQQIEYPEENAPVASYSSHLALPTENVPGSGCRWTEAMQSHPECLLALADQAPPVFAAQSVADASVKCLNKHQSIM